MKSWIVSLAILILPAGCVAKPRQSTPTEPAFQEPAPPEPTKVELTWTIPRLELQADTPSEQTRGGVKIIATVASFKKTIAYDREAPKQVAVKSGATGADRYVYYEDVETPRAVLDPDRLVFKFRVTNQTKRVLRMQGAVLSFKVDGVNAELKASNYESFVTALLTPGASREYTVAGPPVDVLNKNEAVAELALFDVPVEMDAAGNKTKVETYTWLYRVTTETTREPVASKVTRRVEDRLEGRCQGCDGRGRLGDTCPQCRGRGREAFGKCRLCGGRRIHVCPTCTGTGLAR